MKTNEYDLKRFPAYTDRILFESVQELPQQNPLMNIYYGKVDYDLSDHKPITGLFEAKIKVVDQKAKDELINEITDKYEESFSDSENSRKTEFFNQLDRRKAQNLRHTDLAKPKTEEALQMQLKKPLD